MSSDSKDSHTVAGQYLISFEASVTDAARAELFKKWNVKELEKVGSSPLYLIEISPGPQAEGTVKGLKTGVGVRYVEPNFKMHTFGS